jgi:hypothetical protein
MQEAFWLSSMTNAGFVYKKRAKSAPAAARMPPVWAVLPAPVAGTGAQVEAAGAGALKRVSRSMLNAWLVHLRGAGWVDWCSWAGAPRAAAWAWVWSNWSSG